MPEDRPLTEEDRQLLGALTYYGEAVLPTEACTLMGWSATLSPASKMRAWLEELTDMGLLIESIRRHRIVYTVKNPKYWEGYAKEFVLRCER